MNKFLAMILGFMMIGLAACGEDSSTEEANGKESNNANGAESEVNIEELIEQVSMDATIDANSDRATFNFSLTNTGEEPVVLGFTSSQKYEIKVTNEQGESVYTFSANKMFTQELTTEEIPAGGEYSVSESWIENVKPGEYEATITFLVNSINDQPVEAQPFQVTQSFTIEEAGQSGTDATNDSTNAQEDGSQSEQTTEPGQAFRQLEVEGENGSYVVTGEARVFEGNFLYSVEDGHNVVIKPTTVQVEEGAPSWSAFEIEVNLAEEKLPEYGTLTMTLFEESAKNGERVNMNHLVLEKFRPAE